MLPTIAQQVVVKLIWNSNVREFLQHENLDQQFSTCVALLQDLKLVNSSGEEVIINNDFRRAYLHSVMLGAHRCANLVSVESEDKKKTKDISKKSAERWECILKYLALPSEQNMSSVSIETRQLFRSAGFTSGDEGDMDITSMGFQFLLMSPVHQMWTYIRGSDPTKACYMLDEKWTSKQIEMIFHLRELGLIFIRKRKDGFFFLTPLLWNLSVARESESREERKSGNIIVETNFRLYAYTDSSLQLAILSTFTDMTYRFNDMCVGILTRESVRRALQVGITAAQIISFLRTNSHSQCVTSRGPINCLPITVADQIRLWEDERKRLNMTDAVLYTSFENEIEYTDVRDYTSAENILQYADNTQQLVIVTEEGHSLVKQWWKDHRT